MWSSDIMMALMQMLSQCPAVKERQGIVTQIPPSKMTPGAVPVIYLRTIGMPRSNRLATPAWKGIVDLALIVEATDQSDLFDIAASLQTLMEDLTTLDTYRIVTLLHDEADRAIDDGKKCQAKIRCTLKVRSTNAQPIKGVDHDLAC